MAVAAGEPAAVIPNQPIAIREDLLTSERKEGVRDMASVNEQYRIPFTVKLVLQPFDLAHCRLLLAVVRRPTDRV
jgi:hypothetical protein